MQTAEVPEDVLVIRYVALAPEGSPLVRLQVLAAIGRLLAEPVDSLTLDNLVADERAKAALLEWLASEEATKFWRSDDARVVSLRACEKHILVGTRHLLGDLSVLTSQRRRPQLTDLYALWRAASVFVDQYIGKESNSRGAENE